MNGTTARVIGVNLAMTVAALAASAQAMAWPSCSHAGSNGGSSQHPAEYGTMLERLNRERGVISGSPHGSDSPASGYPQGSADGAVCKRSVEGPLLPAQPRGRR